ncbi:MAG: L-seryl-tRNA(Sec) selenium transferase [Deltaproteobacteria bacterium]|nr:L-seryl-tRNA(Sec) selenium transferase [Deltaproteobacteria bacterium]
MSEPSPRSLRALPPAHQVLASDVARRLSASLSPEALLGMVREALDGVRSELLQGSLPEDREHLTLVASRRLEELNRQRRVPKLRRVFNATGVVLHTNLGRAPLGPEAAARVAEAAQGYVTLEYDLRLGRRGHRDEPLKPLLRQLLGAEDALVVNNNAAAVLLAVTALAAGREVLVSRGELVEIGGGFRIPDVLASCGARLVEVGTTNRTRAEDYARAVTPNTTTLLKVHRSNFALVGFTREPTLQELAAVARDHKLTLVEDLGSGALVDTSRFGLPREPTARESLAAGVDLVTISGDKLLGGPQAGIVAGRAAVVERLRVHPLLRALRPGRLVLAALEATLQAYADGREAERVPAVAALALSAEAVKARAEALLARLAALLPEATLELVPTEARTGAGSLPLGALRSWAVAVGGRAPDALEAALRAVDEPVLARRWRDRVLLDARTLEDQALASVARAVSEAWRLAGAPRSAASAPPPDRDHDSEDA